MHESIQQVLHELVLQIEQLFFILFILNSSYP